MSLIRRQQGLSLIELMVSLLIGLLLMAAVLQMFVGSRVTYSMQTELAKLQENARFAMDFIRNDLRMAGYGGCRNHEFYPENSITSVLTGITDIDALINPLVLTDNNGTTPDELRLQYTASACEVSEVISVNSGESYFVCSADHGFQRGAILVASDCQYKAIFQMTNPEGTDSRQIHHSSNNELTPGNCSGGLGNGGATCDHTTDVAKLDWSLPTVEGQVSETQVQTLLTYTYKIKQENGWPVSLYRNDGSTDHQMVEGVENMQIELGFDSDQDGSVNCYGTATSCATSDSNAIAARLHLLMISTEDNIIDSRPANEFANTVFAGYAPEDNRLRKVFTSTISLRNRLIENDRN